MTNPTVALRTESSITVETIIELFDNVDVESASRELQELTSEVEANVNDVIDVGDRHEKRGRDDPCPECGNEELLFMQIVSDVYTCTGSDTLINDNGELIESTVMVECIECGERLYRRPGVGVMRSETDSKQQSVTDNY